MIGFNDDSRLFNDEFVVTGGKIIDEVIISITSTNIVKARVFKSENSDYVLIRIIV